MYISTSLQDNQEVSKSLITSLIFTTSAATAPYTSPGSIASYGGNGTDYNAYIPVCIMGGVVGFTLHDSGTSVSEMNQQTPQKLVPVQHWIAFNPYTCYSGVTPANDYSWATSVNCSSINGHIQETISVNLGVRLTFANGNYGYVTMSNSCTLPISANTVTIMPNTGWVETFRYATVNYGTDYTPVSGTEITQAYYSATTISTNYNGSNYLSGYTLSGDIKLYITRGPASYVYNYMSLTSGGTVSSLNAKIGTSAIVNSTNSGYSKYDFALKMIPNLTITPTFKDECTWEVSLSRPSNSVSTTVALILVSSYHGAIEARLTLTIPANGTSATGSVKFRPLYSAQVAAVVQSTTPSTHTCTFISGTGTTLTVGTSKTLTTYGTVSTYTGYTVTVNASTINMTVSDEVQGYGTHTIRLLRVYAVTTGGTETLILSKAGATTISFGITTVSLGRQTTTVNGVKRFKMSFSVNAFNGVGSTEFAVAGKGSEVYEYTDDMDEVVMYTEDLSSNITITSPGVDLVISTGD